MKTFTLTDDQEQKIKEWLEEIKPNIIKEYLTETHDHYTFHIYKVIDNNSGKVKVQVNPLSTTQWIRVIQFHQYKEDVIPKIGERVVLGVLKDDPFDVKSWFVSSVCPENTGNLSYTFSPTGIGDGVVITEETTRLTLDVTDVETW